jgi:glycosyltransferase involved in cell wall biosynthesis
VYRVEYPGRRALFYGAGAPENLARRPVWSEIPAAMAALCYQAARLAPQADLIAGHWLLPTGAIAALLARIFRKPFAGVAHSGDVHLLERIPARLAAPLRLLWNGAPLACVAHHQRPILERFSSRVRVLPMGVDAELFDATRDRAASRESLGARGFCVLVLGRLVPVKGIDVLLRALHRLPATLWIAGDGPERPSLEALAASLGVSTRFFGPVAGTLRRQLFAAADLFVLPSRVLPDRRSEGMPVSLLEAAAAGLPLVASSVGGVADRFTHAQHALLVPPEDVSALKAAIVSMIDSPSLREQLAQHARNQAEELRWEKVAQAYEDFFDLAKVSPR